MIKTLQEKFWQGNFGNHYIKRNLSSKKREFFFKTILKTNNIKFKNIFEIGTNNGVNLNAIKSLNKDIKTFGLELNKNAFDIARKNHKVYNESALNFKSDKKYDLVLTSCVLIHINPKQLKKIYDLIYKLSKKYILINEYHNPTPVSVNYRGYKNVLFKRNFAGEIMKKYNLKLVDYGFCWKDDKKHYFEDTNWFLFKK